MNNVENKKFYFVWCIVNRDQVVIRPMILTVGETVAQIILSRCYFGFVTFWDYFKVLAYDIWNSIFHFLLWQMTGRYTGIY